MICDMEVRQIQNASPESTRAHSRRDHCSVTSQCHQVIQLPCMESSHCRKMVFAKVDAALDFITQVYRQYIPRCEEQVLILPLPPASTVPCPPGLTDRSLFNQVKAVERKAMKSLRCRPRRIRALHVLPYPEERRTTHALDPAACTEAFSLMMYMKYLHSLRYCAVYLLRLVLTAINRLDLDIIQLLTNYLKNFPELTKLEIGSTLYFLELRDLPITKLTVVYRVLYGLGSRNSTFLIADLAHLIHLDIILTNNSPDLP